jgi:hypothetical protein
MRLRLLTLVAFQHSEETTKSTANGLFMCGLSSQSFQHLGRGYSSPGPLYRVRLRNRLDVLLASSAIDTVFRLVDGKKIQLLEDFCWGFEKLQIHSR